MKRLITLFLIAFTLTGCSEKTHSGVYESVTLREGYNSVQSFDFRADGTVIHRSVTTGMINSDKTKKGTYEIRGEVIHIDFEGLSEGDIEKKWNQFKIEGDDLIWLTNDKRLTRK